MKKILLNILLIIFCFVFVPESCVGSKEDVADNFNKLLKHTGFIAQLEKNTVAEKMRTLNISKDHVGAMLNHIKSNNHIVTRRLGETKPETSKVYLEGFDEVDLNKYKTLGSETEELEEKEKNLTNGISKLKTRKGYLEELKNKFNKTPPSSDSDKSPSSSGETSSSSSSDSEVAKKEYLDKVEKLDQEIKEILDKKSKSKDVTKKLENEITEELDKIKKELDEITEKFLKRTEDELKSEVYESLQGKVRSIEISIHNNNSSLKETRDNIRKNKNIIKKIKELLLNKYKLETEDQVKAFLNWALSEKSTIEGRNIVTAINATSQEGDSDAFMLNLLLKSIDWHQEAHYMSKNEDYDQKIGINKYTLKLALEMKEPQHYFQQGKTPNGYSIKSGYSNRMILVLGKDENEEMAYIKTFYISGCDESASR